MERFETVSQGFVALRFELLVKAERAVDLIWEISYGENGHDAFTSKQSVVTDCEFVLRTRLEPRLP